MAPGVPPEEVEREGRQEEHDSVEDGRDPSRVRRLEVLREELGREREKRDEEQREEIETYEGAVNGAYEVRDRVCKARTPRW